MVLQKKQIEESLAGGPVEEESNFFGLQASEQRKWSHGIVPYTLDSSISKFDCVQLHFIRNLLEKRCLQIFPQTYSANIYLFIS